jgi:hypothetical protein
VFNVSTAEAEGVFLIRVIRSRKRLTRWCVDEGFVEVFLRCKWLVEVGKDVPEIDDSFEAVRWSLAPPKRSISQWPEDAMRSQKKERRTSQAQDQYRLRLGHLGYSLCAVR